MDWLTNYFAPLQNGLTTPDIAVFTLLVFMTLMWVFNLKGWKKYASIAMGILAILIYSHKTIESARVQQVNEKRAQQVQQVNEKRAQQRDERLKEENRLLNNKLDDANKKLDDLTQTITKSVPGLEGGESYDSIIAFLKNMESRTTTLEKETQKTTFIVGDESGKQLPDGTFEAKFNLVPKGKNIVPLFKLSCQTSNNAKITDIIISRNNTSLTGMSSTYSSPDKTYFDVEINNIEPGILNVFVLTDKKPELSCDYMPKN